MATTDQYLIYYIYLTDLAQIQALQGSHVQPAPGIIGNGIGAILAAPDDAAIKYSAPIQIPPTAFVPPSITSSWFGTPNQFPTNVATFDRKSGGWFGWSFLFGDTTHYHWRGIFVYSPPAVPSGGGAVAIANRRWIDGFELPAIGEGGAGSGSTDHSREASRHPQGMGFAIRGACTGPRSHTQVENTGVTMSEWWERFYIRPRQFPAAPTQFWFYNTSVSPAIGLTLSLTPSGQIAVSSVDAVGNLSLVATTAALTLNTWVRIDLHPVLSAAGQALTLWINGTVVLDISTAAGGSAGLKGTGSTIGVNAASTLGLDVDDWLCAEWPGVVDGVDFQNGSGMFLISPTGYDASSSGWAGDFRILLQNPVGAAAQAVTSSTLNAPLVVTTDAHHVISEHPDAIGLAALLVALQATTIQATLATIGLTGTDLTAPLNRATTQPVGNWATFLYRLPGGTTAALQPAHPINLVFTHGAAGLTTVRAFFGVVELIGDFGPEDAPHVTPAVKVLPPHLGIHNAPYPYTAWARLTTTPIQPVFIRTGTYVGTGTGQDLTFPVPIHWFRVRPLAGDTGGTRWWSSLLASHKTVEKQVTSALMPQAGIDPTFVPGALDTPQMQAILRLAGSDTQNNAVGVTYAYIAIGDPGMRFMLNGCVRYHKGAVDEVTTLANTFFTPQAGWFLADEVGNDAATGLSYKGPGDTPSGITFVGVAEVANAVSFGAAALTTKAAFADVAVNAIAFNLWRADDGSPGNGGKVVQLQSYTGDGSGARTIGFSPATGKRPLYAVVASTTGVFIERDPSHLGTTSTQLPATPNAATGITGGGLDTLSVGAALNVNGVVYNVFVIVGDSVAGNGGFSVTGDVVPVSPDPPPLAPHDAESPQEPPDGPVADPTDGDGGTGGPPPDPLPPEGPMPSLTDDLETACEPATRGTINIALSRIGISKSIPNVATTQSAEATAVRLVYNDAIQQTLRDFPWPFATRYVQLALLNAGARPNSDWRYVYRQPSDCLFERRLVVSRVDVANPAAIPFQLSSDDTGGLIFTNLQAAVLEYTARPKCPHTRSEPLFRDAAAWKLAFALAPSLSKLTDAAVRCAQAYQATIDQAYLVLRPGNAGDVPATATIDTSAAAQAANLTVANLALIQIGAQTIRNLTTDQSREAQLVRIVFEQELRATLRDYPWPFATVYLAPTLVAGTTTVGANADWQYSYRLPADVVFARRLVTPRRRAYEPNPSTFVVAKDATGSLLMTNQVSTDPLAPLTVEYTTRPEGAVLVSDPLFREALAWRLSWKLAPSLALLVPDRPEAVGRGPDASAEKTKERTSTGATLRTRAADAARQCYYQALSIAETGAAREAQPDETNVDASWISDRN